jgi:cytochrome c553
MLEFFDGAVKRQILMLAIALGLGLAGEARSAETVLLAGDATAGRAVAANCALCHGIDGISHQPGIPHLAGQHAGYIQGAALAYKSGTRKLQPMQQIFDALSDQDIANVAAYYASLTGFSSRPKDAGAAAATTPEPDPYAAVKQTTAACAGCHGQDGNAMFAGTPSLAGQHATYLTLAIKSYLAGSRGAPMMQALVKPLSPGDIEDVAYFFAAMEPRRADFPAKGDPYAGVAASAPCAACHGQDGNNTDPKIPRLAGLDAQYLETAINAYKNGTRPNDAMRSQASSLGDQDIKNIAAFYASKQPTALPARKLLTVAQWVERCGRCHGANGNSTDTRFPVLAGQDEAYLNKALALYHLDDRPSTLMFAMSFLMTDSDIKKLAAFYARQRKE